MVRWDRLQKTHPRRCSAFRRRRDRPPQRQERRPRPREVGGVVVALRIASGGAGKAEDFYDVLTKAKADAALAASLFHDSQLEIQSLKKYLLGRGVPIRVIGE